MSTEPNKKSEKPSKLVLSNQAQPDGQVLGNSYDASTKLIPENSTVLPSILIKPNTCRLDPTRYGDWEKKGRCIDF